MTNPSSMNVLNRAVKAVPAVRYALGVAGIGAAVAIIAGLTGDYKVAVFGTIIMFGLMFVLVIFSSFAKSASPEVKPPALVLAYAFVILIIATSILIFTSFFFQWPRTLESYVQAAQPMNSTTPTPTASPPIASSQPVPSVPSISSITPATPTLTQNTNLSLSTPTPPTTEQTATPTPTPTPFYSHEQFPSGVTLDNWAILKGKWSGVYAIDETHTGGTLEFYLDGLSPKCKFVNSSGSFKPCVAWHSDFFGIINFRFSNGVVA